MHDPDVRAEFQRLNRERGQTILLVTHENSIAAYAARTITVQDGQIASDSGNEKLRSDPSGQRLHYSVSDSAKATAAS